METAKEIRLSKLMDSSQKWTEEEIMIRFAKLHLESFISEMDAYDIFRYESLIEETFNNIK